MRIERKSMKLKRKLRVRRRIFGITSKPRLSVFRSNKYIYGQLIDDTTGKTITCIQAEAPKLHAGKNKIDAAATVGMDIAKKAIEMKIKEVVFDRNGYRYHGRVKSFAEGARKGGLKF